MEGIPPIEPFLFRLDALTRKMGEPDFYSDQRAASAVSREHQHLSRLRDAWKRLENALSQIAENRKIVEENSDPELAEMAREDMESLSASVEPLKNEILRMMIPPNPTDSRNTVVEIRAGTGGDEASLFAADLYRMYCRYADSKGWKVENLSSSESPAGGFKEICFLLSGDDVYRSMKYESGTHRVQRVPVTEASGRIHTSAATVAVLPEAEEVDIQIPPQDIEISIARASGPGGQGVNTTDSAVRVTHFPSGIVVTCQNERSQLQNKEVAMRMLKGKLIELQEREREEQMAQIKGEMKRIEWGSQIRSYVFQPYTMVKDHRTGVEDGNIQAVMDGELDEFINAYLVQS